MKHKTLVDGVILAVFFLSSLLSACTPAQTEVIEEAPSAPEATAAKEPTTEPTANLEPTTEPTPEPASEPPDYIALFTTALANISPDKSDFFLEPFPLSREMMTTEAFVLDVRESAEIEATGYIEGAVNIPVRDLMKNLDKLPDQDSLIVVVSPSKYLSGFVLAALKIMGYANVLSLDGGMPAWIEANKPVVSGVPEAPIALNKLVLENQQLVTELDAWFSSLPEDLYSIQPDKLNGNLAGGTIPAFIDVNSDDERAQVGYIKDAVHIPLSQLMASLDQLPADKAAPVVVYALSEHLGAVATMAMQLLGYTDVVSLAGGLNAWKAAQPPLEYNVGWLPATPLPEPHGGGLVRCSDDPDSIYITSGAVEDFVSSNRNYRYDIDTASWQRLADIPRPIRFPGLACYEGKIYIAGGWDGPMFDTLFVYDIQEDEWSQGPDLPEAVWGAAMGAWDGKLYLVGGNRGGDTYAPDNQVDVYDIASQTWTGGGGANMPTASGFYASVQDGAFLYIVGGFSGDFDHNVNQTQRYDMSTNTWEVGPNFTSARAYGTMAVTSSHLYMAGGDENGGDIVGMTDLVEVLDLSTWPEGAWVEADFLLPAPNALVSTTCTETLAGGEIWNVGGGYVGEDWSLYDEVYYLPVGESCP